MTTLRLADYLPLDGADAITKIVLVPYLPSKYVYPSTRTPQIDYSIWCTDGLVARGTVHLPEIDSWSISHEEWRTMLVEQINDLGGNAVVVEDEDLIDGFSIWANFPDGLEVTNLVEGSDFDHLPLQAGMGRRS